MTTDSGPVVDWVRRQRDPGAALGALVTAWWPPSAGTRPGLAAAAAPVPRPADPAAVLVAARQSLLGADDRAAGTVFTPPAVARALVERSFDALAAARGGAVDWGALRVLDPAVGGGTFLLAAHDALVARGVPADGAVGGLWGVDVDPLSVAVADAALGLRAGRTLPVGQLRVGDQLDGTGPAGPFDLVVGNPPFRSQLATRTARPAERAAALRARLGDAVVRYVDDAVLFLLDGMDRLAPAGVVALVVPDSVLAAADATAARARLLERGALVGLWSAGERVFDADVHVCAPVLARRPVAPKVGRAGVRRWTGAGWTERPSVPAPGDGTGWAALLADLAGVPMVELSGAGGRLGDGARCTAGFRDQYYGLRGAVTEHAGVDDDRPRLVTSGLVDPAWCRWSAAAARFDKRAWEAPVVDLVVLARTAPDVAAWGEALAVPKLLVATQTRVVEAVVDRSGTLWPSVPVIAVLAPPDDLDHLLAALLAPPVTAWAFGRAAGAALGPDALRLTARQIADVPLPTRGAAWDAAAALLRDEATPAAEAGDAAAWREALVRVGVLMCEAYGVDGGLVEWWAGRLPRRRRTDSLRR